MFSTPNSFFSPTPLFLFFPFFLFFFFSFFSYNPSTTTNIPLQLQHRILFPDHVLLTLSNPHQTIPPPDQLQCVYFNHLNASAQGEPVFNAQVEPVLSTDRFDESRSIARCPLPATNFSGVELRRRGEAGRRSFGFLRWDKLAYEASLDGDTAVVFVKGLNLRPRQVSDPTRFQCHFGPSSFHQDGAFWLATEAVSVAQEVVRCSLPQSFKNEPDKARGISVTVSHVTGHVRQLMPSVAVVNGYGTKMGMGNNKHELCACTMVWNQARALREWVMYHAWLGVERWFIYDNNSDDDIEVVVMELDLKGHNVSRVTWPWLKTQEAAFSHCALMAKEVCKWVAFFDVDEFFYFPNEFTRQLGKGENALRSMVANFSSSDSVAEIRTACHSFGPSGLSSHPEQGVTIGYTCRLQSPERHKSIVRPDLLDASLLNVVHHFWLREGLGHMYLPEGSVVINHYKYQVWESFKAKFYRRVATYVVDWQEEQNMGSKDRAPGLGTKAIEPPDWRFRFCEVGDTGLKDFLLANFADPATGLMPWERAQMTLL